MAKSNNFFLKTVELSWREHRQNVTPATRASSIAQRCLGNLTSQETTNFTGSKNSLFRYFLWKQNSAIRLYRLKSNALFWMHQQFLAWKKEDIERTKFILLGIFLIKWGNLSGKEDLSWSELESQSRCYAINYWIQDNFASSLEKHLCLIYRVFIIYHVTIYNKKKSLRV